MKASQPSFVIGDACAKQTGGLKGQAPSSPLADWPHTVLFWNLRLRVPPGQECAALPFRPVMALGSTEPWASPTHGPLQVGAVCDPGLRAHPPGLLLSARSPSSSSPGLLQPVYLISPGSCRSLALSVHRASCDCQPGRSAASPCLLLLGQTGSALLSPVPSSSSSTAVRCSLTPGSALLLRTPAQPVSLLCACVRACSACAPVVRLCPPPRLLSLLCACDRAPKAR